MKTMFRVAIACLMLCGLGRAFGQPYVLEDFENLTGWQTNGKTASFKKADTAAVGNGAICVTLPGMVYKELSKKPIPGSAAWDKCEGLSFWVKGDGSDLFGCMAVGQGPMGNYCFVHYFPLKDTQWHKLTVSWDDLVPEDQYYPIGTSGALPPSGIMTIRFGTRWTIWHNNNPIPPHQYCIDQVQIEEKVEKPAPAPALRPFSEIQDLFRAKKPVHIVCMGDSITAGTSLKDKEKERYAVLLQDMLRKRLGYDQVFSESRAVGGARLTDARAWVPRDLVGDPPDLVTILYGYNDKSGAHTKAYFKDSLNDYLDRIARKTGGKTAVLLLPTIPGMGPRFVMMDDFADAVRETAQARGLACFDLQKVFKDIGREKVNDLLADMAHPNADGHRLIADSIANFLAGTGTP